MKTYQLLLACAISLAAGAADADISKDEVKLLEVAVDDTVPAFECRDDQGNRWKSVDHVGKEFVVIYFFPADFTRGCRAQAQAFRDSMNKMAAAGITVIGISGDSVGNHELFKSVENLNFTLLADEDGSVARKFGVPLDKGGEVAPRDEQNKPMMDAEGNPLILTRAVTAARWTFIVGMEGKIVYKNTKVVPAKDARQVAAFIEDLQKK